MPVIDDAVACINELIENLMQGSAEKEAVKRQIIALVADSFSLTIETALKAKAQQVDLLVEVEVLKAKFSQERAKSEHLERQLSEYERSNEFLHEELQRLDAQLEAEKFKVAELEARVAMGEDSSIDPSSFGYDSAF